MRGLAGVEAARDREGGRIREGGTLHLSSPFHSRHWFVSSRCLRWISHFTHSLTHSLTDYPPCVSLTLYFFKKKRKKERNISPLFSAHLPTFHPLCLPQTPPSTHHKQYSHCTTFRVTPVRPVRRSPRRETPLHTCLPPIHRTSLLPFPLRPSRNRSSQPPGMGPRRKGFGF